MRLEQRHIAPLRTQLLGALTTSSLGTGSPVRQPIMAILRLPSTGNTWIAVNSSCQHYRPRGRASSRAYDIADEVEGKQRRRQRFTARWKNSRVMR